MGKLCFKNQDFGQMTLVRSTWEAYLGLFAIMSVGLGPPGQTWSDTLGVESGSIGQTDGFAWAGQGRFLEGRPLR